MSSGDATARAGEVVCQPCVKGMWQCARVGCKMELQSAVDARVPTSSPKGERMMPSCYARLLTLPLIAALCWTPVLVRAGDAEDCASPVPDKIEPACTAIISDAAKPADDRLKALVNRSRLFIARAKIDLALADAEAAVLLNPKSVPALLQRGYAQQRKGNHDGALADFNRAIEVDTKSAIAWFNRGNLRNIQRNFADALPDFNQAITLRPDYAQAYASRGLAYTETGQLDQA